jgi:hypothetical protein
MSKNQSVDVSIIIITWKAARFISDCLDSIQRSSSKLSVETIVVDNDSQDGIEKIVSKYNRTKFVQMGCNAGFANANDRGAVESSGKYLLFLNPDAILTTDAISGLYQTVVENPRIGLVAPQLLNTNGSIQMSIQRRFPNFFSHLLKYNFFALALTERIKPGYDPLLESYEAHTYPHTISWAMGAAFMIPAKIFHQVGGFDKDFFLYYEETLLMLRVRQAGFDIFFQPSAKVTHALSESIGEKNHFGQSSPYFIRSGYLYFKKAYGLPVELSLKAATLIELVLCWVVLAALNLVPQLSDKHPFIKHGYTFTKRSIQNHF